MMKILTSILVCATLLGCSHSSRHASATDAVILSRLESTVVPSFRFGQSNTIEPLEAIVQAGLNASPQPIAIDITPVMDAWAASVQKHMASPQPTLDPEAVRKKPSAIPSQGFSTTVTMDLKDKSLHYVLDSFCDVVGLKWRISKGKVIVSPADPD